MNSGNRNTGHRCALAVAALAALAIPALAQDHPPIQSVVIYRVKADRIGDFQAALRDHKALLKQNSSTQYRTLWASQSGPREYALVRYYAKWADLDMTQDPALQDHQAEATRIFVRIGQCTESATRIISEVQPDMSITSSGEMPKMVRLIRNVVKPDRVNDYIALMKSDVMPAVKKAGLKTYVVTRTRFGGPNSEFRSVAGVDSWADMDSPAPVVRAMGDEGYQSFVAKLGPMLVETEFSIFRYMPDLSYMPEQNVSTADRQK